MPYSFFFRLCFFSVFFVLVACSAEVSRTLVQDSKPQKDQAIAVINIRWEEYYLDLESKEDVRVFSNELDVSADLVRRKSVKYGKNQLKSPLYYISKQKFLFEGENHRIGVEKYANSLRDYEDLGIYSFPPDRYDLKKLYQDEKKLFIDTSKEIIERWFKKREEHAFPVKSWKLDAGKIYYLGDLTLFFSTRKIQFGLFPPEMLNKNIQLVRAKWTNRFEETKQELKKNKPWFPADLMIDLAPKPEDKVYRDHRWIPYEPDSTDDAEENRENRFW